MQVKVTPMPDGAMLTVDGIEITITVKSLEEKPAMPPLGRPTAISDVEAALAKYAKDLKITEEEEGIVVKPIRFLGRDIFAEVAGAIRNLGGKYISAGRKSRFIIPKEK